MDHLCTNSNWSNVDGEARRSRSRMEKLGGVGRGVDRAARRGSSAARRSSSTVQGPGGEPRRGRARWLNSRWRNRRATAAAWGRTRRDGGEREFQSDWWVPRNRVTSQFVAGVESKFLFPIFTCQPSNKKVETLFEDGACLLPTPRSLRCSRYVASSYSFPYFWWTNITDTKLWPNNVHNLTPLFGPTSKGYVKNKVSGGKITQWCQKTS